MANPGDLVEVATKDEKLKGILMPSITDSVVLKLDNGYNVGIDKKKVKEIRVMQKFSKKEEEHPKAVQKAGLPKISVLHTGGTIASKVDYETGGVIARFSPEELIAMFPEIKNIANVNSRLIRSMFSEDMRFAHYNILAKEVEKEIKSGADGIIITHGTDTMHYSAAALAFMLENLPVPVVLVGAQRSSDRGSSDAAVNFISAALFITKSDFADVAICMHESLDDDSCLILPATKSRKMHTSRRDTFRPINDFPWAKVNYKTKEIHYYKTNYNKKNKENKLKVTSIKDDLKIGILTSHPNMFAQEILNYKGFDGLVMAGTGLGHLPVNEIDAETKEHTKILQAVKDVVKSGTVVVMSPQTIYGRIDMNVYSTGRKQQQVGIIGNLSDMTPETTFVKLAWLLSNHPKQKVAELMTKSLRGELNEKISDTLFMI